MRELVPIDRKAATRLGERGQPHKKSMKLSFEKRKKAKEMSR